MKTHTSKAVAAAAGIAAIAVSVPLAVSAYTEQLRELLSIRGVEDYAAFTPGLNFSSNDRITLRGIGQLTDALGSDPGVAIYTDGFYSPNSPEINRTPLFVERVEVLRDGQRLVGEIELR